MLKNIVSLEFCDPLIFGFFCDSNGKNLMSFLQMHLKVYVYMYNELSVLFVVVSFACGLASKQSCSILFHYGDLSSGGQ